MPIVPKRVANIPNAINRYRIRCVLTMINDSSVKQSL
jgi:hypothetical protein